VTAGWVEAQFGVRLDGDAALPDLVRLALRRNPRRAHLLVSTVLGKHIPADPRLVRSTARELGARVEKALDGKTALVIGFAETATGLGHGVAEALGADYLHSTRRAVDDAAVVIPFDEEHSHATTHRLLPEALALLRSGEVVVLVDDEISTGRTALNALRAVQPMRTGTRWIVASLVDMRTAEDARAAARFAEEQGIEIEFVSLAQGAVDRPSDFPVRAAAAVAALAPPAVAPAPPTAARNAPARAELRMHRGLWPDGVREAGRHGFGPADVRAAHDAAARVAAALAPECGSRVLVLGTEELMYAPTLIADALADRLPDVRVSATTRSPVIELDDPRYPIRTALAFGSSDRPVDGPGPRFAYNIGAELSDIVVVVDAVADTPALYDGLVEQLRARADRIHVVVLPCYAPPPALRGPRFGSYQTDEVAWLLTDLSDVPLEAPVEEREEAIQSGGAHYAESLPVEFQPDADYQRLFDKALDESAARIAHAVGVVTEIVLAERGPAPVLASLARAGTPVGILMRRWAAFAHGLALPHYAASIVRGRGIDGQALRYLAARHDPNTVVFMDGWTGKGAIARELAAAVNTANAELGASFSPALAVLADPGHCVSTFGTRDDFLVPSACLNSTVSGLVSRTVLNADVLRPGQFHGAKFYRELAAADVSARFLDAISERFAEVAADVARDWPVAQAAERTPTWTGWRDVERLSAEYGIDDVNLVKPGVGETTRVLLRRVPWLVLARTGAGPELDHVRMLAERRGVRVEEVDELSFSCVGLIHPRYTRGATGADGFAVAP
jgi:adenine/guanine phosphoribosyltransferase-like PRPP-binding protein